MRPDSKRSREFRSERAKTTNTNGNGGFKTFGPGHADCLARPHTVEAASSGYSGLRHASNPSALFIRRQPDHAGHARHIVFGIELSPAAGQRLAQRGFSTVLITASLPGANADTMASAVATLSASSPRLRA
jgi:hypothetical protein